MELHSQLLGNNSIIVLLAIVLLWWVFEAYQRRLWEAVSALWQRITLLSMVAGLRQRYPRTWSFLGARLSPTHYMGLHLSLGLLVVLVALDGQRAVRPVVSAGPLRHLHQQEVARQAFGS